MSDEALSFVPAPTLTFLGGPLDGFVAEPDVEPSLDVVFPDWIIPDGESFPYVLACACHLPAWIVTAPQMDMFDAVYVWLPYIPQAEGDGDIPVEPEPQPEYL